MGIQNFTKGTHFKSCSYPRSPYYCNPKIGYRRGGGELVLTHFAKTLITENYYFNNYMKINDAMDNQNHNKANCYNVKSIGKIKNQTL